jgi:hypothetical protein
MTSTGIYLSPEQYKEVVDLLNCGGTIQLKPKGIVITTPARVLAEERLAEFALQLGLPKLPAKKSYGLTSQREIVAP